MIRRKHQPVEYDVAECDGCKCDLRQRAGEDHENVNYGLLKGCFGWPSTLDDMHGPEYHLCEVCWAKVLAVFDLPVSAESTGENHTAETLRRADE